MGQGKRLFILLLALVVGLPSLSAAETWWEWFECKLRNPDCRPPLELSNESSGEAEVAAKTTARLVEAGVKGSASTATVWAQLPDTVRTQEVLDYRLCLAFKNCIINKEHYQGLMGWTIQATVQMNPGAVPLAAPEPTLGTTPVENAVQLPAEIEPLPTPKRDLGRVAVVAFRHIPEDDIVIEALTRKVERNFVGLLTEHQFPVAHRQNPGSELAESAFSISGAVERRDGERAELSVYFAEGGKIVAMTEFSASVAFLAENYRSLAEALIIAMGLSPESLRRQRDASATNEADVLYLEAARLARIGDVESADARLAALLEDRPEDAEALWARSRICEARRDKDCAQKFAQRADAANPDHPRPSFVGKATNPMPALMQAAQVSGWRGLNNGVEHRSFEAPNYGVVIDGWRFSPEMFHLDVVMSTKPGGATAAELRAQADGILAINGGYFDIDGKGRLSPSGLVVSSGRRIAPETEKGGTGVIHTEGSMVSISFLGDYVNSGGAESAVQAGPLVVDPGGRNGIISQDANRMHRSAACLLKDGRVVLLAITGELGLALREVGELLAASESSGGFGCERALNLDGGPSTQVSFADGHETLEIEGRWKVINALVVSPRPREPCNYFGSVRIPSQGSWPEEPSAQGPFRITLIGTQQSKPQHVDFRIKGVGAKFEDVPMRREVTGETGLCTFSIEPRFVGDREATFFIELSSRRPR